MALVSGAKRSADVTALDYSQVPQAHAQRLRRDPAPLPGHPRADHRHRRAPRRDEPQARGRARAERGRSRVSEPLPPPPGGAARGFLFLLAHMRSQSSLLAHQLASHPEIAGHSELHRRYETRADLSVMRTAIEAQLGAPAARAGSSTRCCTTTCRSIAGSSHGTTCARSSSCAGRRRRSRASCAWRGSTCRATTTTIRSTRGRYYIRRLRDARVLRACARPAARLRRVGAPGRRAGRGARRPLALARARAAARVDATGRSRRPGATATAIRPTYILAGRVLSDARAPRSGARRRRDPRRGPRDAQAAYDDALARFAPLGRVAPGALRARRRRYRP